MADAMESLVSEARNYEDAMQSELDCMERGLALGTRGKAIWTRDELHER